MSRFIYRVTNWCPNSVHISVLSNKTQNMQIVGMLVCHMSKYFGPKNHFLHPSKTWDHYALVFYTLLHKLILLFLRFEFAQESKKFWEMDIDDVQKSIWRNLFGKIDAALGVLRNFLGTTFGRPYMQWQNNYVVFCNFYLVKHTCRTPGCIFLSRVLKRMSISTCLKHIWCDHFDGPK